MNGHKIQLEDVGTPTYIPRVMFLISPHSYQVKAGAKTEKIKDYTTNIQENFRLSFSLLIGVIGP